MIDGDHVRPWSKKCPNYNQYQSSKGKTKDNDEIGVTEKDDEQEVRDANEQGLLDQINFDADTEFLAAVEELLDDDSDASNL